MSEKDNSYKKYNKIGDKNFKWQKDCSNSISNQQNVILSSPTGSGKTKVFLEWTQNHKERPIIITAPIKALSNQRYRELLADGYTVGLETGDIKNVPDNCDFICCTQEIYTNKYLEMEDVTLIMDEFHYIFENPDRSRAYIDSLYGSKAKNMLLCSATLGSMKKLTKYVNRVSGRKFFSYKNDSRATSLSYEGNIDYKDIKNSLVIVFSRDKIEKILDDLMDSRDVQDEKTLEAINKFAKEYKIDNDNLVERAEAGIAGYHGTLLPKEKLFIEKCFEQKLIDTIVGTDALALGVNFPVENVVFAQLAKYYDGPISKNLFDQIAGRAGRKGFFDEGHVYYCSWFNSFCESYKYYTKDLFEQKLKQPNEDLSIMLTPNIKNILLDKVTIGEEAEFIARFSTEKVNVDEKFREISASIEYIKNNPEFEDIVDEIVYGKKNDEYEEYDEYEDEYEYEEYDDLDDEKYEYEEYINYRSKLQELCKLTPKNVGIFPNGCRERAFENVLKCINTDENPLESINPYDLEKCLETCTNNRSPKTGVKLSEDEKLTLTQKKLVVPFLNWVFENKDVIENYMKENDEKFSSFEEKMNRKLEEERQEEQEKEMRKNKLMSKKAEFDQNIGRVYFAEFTPKKNCRVFSEILLGVDSDEILEKYGSSNNFNELLQFRKYVASLPRKYRIGLTKINEKVRERDEFAIDGFRGSVSIEEISESLEKEGKLDGKNVQQVLNEQEYMKKLNERTGIMDEQLDDVDKYELEER